MGQVDAVGDQPARLAAMGLAILGAIPCGLGMLVVGPLLSMATAVFYKRLFGIAGGAERIGM